MSMFFPFGIFSGEVVDPEALGDEFQEALRVASNTTHHQWQADSIDKISKLDTSKLCNVHVKRINASFQDTGYVGQKLAASENTAAYEDGYGKNANTWLVPYRRGFQEVGDGDTLVQWTSEYPELIFSCFSFQIAMWSGGWAESTGTSEHPSGEAYWSEGTTPRVQVKIQVDGARIPGTGPYSRGVTTQYRGQGIHDGLVRSAVFSCNVLAAGDHSVTAVAAQTGAEKDQEQSADYGDLVPTEGVAICQRSMTVVRMAMGGHLGS